MSSNTKKNIQEKQARESTLSQTLLIKKDQDKLSEHRGGISFLCLLVAWLSFSVRSCTPESHQALRSCLAPLHQPKKRGSETQHPHHH